MSLLGIAIIGKSNEPLYLCDCTRLLNDNDDDKNKESPDATTNKSDKEDDDTTDLFGFLEATASRGQRQSLPLERQFMMHAALDRLEELIGTSKPDGTMPLRPTNSRGGQSANLASNAHWLGLLTVQDGDCAVYGHVVVATNLKFLALVQATAAANNKRNNAATAAVKKLLASLHDNYIDYVMNPFSPIRGPIDSPRFDANVRATVANYAKETKDT